MVAIPRKVNRTVEQEEVRHLLTQVGFAADASSRDLAHHLRGERGA